MQNAAYLDLPPVAAHLTGNLQQCFHESCLVAPLGLLDHPLREDSPHEARVLVLLFYIPMVKETRRPKAKSVSRFRKCCR